MIISKITKEDFEDIEKVSELSEGDLQVISDEFYISLKNMWFVLTNRLSGEDKRKALAFIEDVQSNGYIEMSYNDNTDLWLHNDIPVMISSSIDGYAIFLTSKFVNKVSRLLDKY